MNFYDKVHELVTTLKQTQEYTDYINIKKEIKDNKNICDMIIDFKEKQRTQQIEYINTNKMDEQKQKELENMYSILIQNELARKFLESEMRLDIMLADMQKIIGEGIKEIIEF